MFEAFIVTVIVAGVSILAARSAYRTFTGREEGCGKDCACSGTCGCCSGKPVQTDIGQHDHAPGKGSAQVSLPD